MRNCVLVHQTSRLWKLVNKFMSGKIIKHSRFKEREVIASGERKIEL